MSRARVLGRNVTLLVHSSQLVLPIALGTIDEFSATSTTDIIKRRPAGSTIEAARLRYGGYDLSFKIGKMDPMLERWNHLVERGMFADANQPQLFISETTKHYNKLAFGIPILENWIYRNVTLYGLSKTTGDDIEMTIKGFATHKELGPVDSTFLTLEWLPGIGFQEIVHRTAQTKIDIGGAINNILKNPFGSII